MLNVVGHWMLVIPLLVGAHACRRPPNEMSDLVATDHNGILTIQFPDAGPHDAVEVEVQESQAPFWSWFPRRFPARISVPFGAKVIVIADRAGFLRSRQEHTVTRMNPDIQAVIELQEEPGLFGVRRSDIPKNVGVRAIAPTVTGQPGEMLFAIQGGSILRLDNVLLLDDQARVWRSDGGGADSAVVYQLVAMIESKDFAEMEERCKAASDAEMVSEAPSCSDCRWKNAAVCRVPGATTVTLAVDGASRGRRRNDASDVLIRWLLAINRDAPVPAATP